MKQYFKNSVEYPQDVIEDILPINVLWEYIGTPFLNAFINHISIKCAFVHARYHRWEDNLGIAVGVMDPPGSFTWVKFTGTKQEVFERLTQQGATIHSNLDRDFQDDVIILGKMNATWMFFWFDRDCSDSCIGRFQTEDSDEVVIQYFKEYIMSLPRDLGDSETPKEIPLLYFRGWLHS